MKTSPRSSDSIQSGQPDAPGQGEEGSVMFSLSALMNQAAASPTPPSPPTTSDDSGLIDLKGLLSGSNKAPVASLIPAHVDVFPLGRPPLPSTEAVEVSVPVGAAKAVRKTKAVWIAGAGLLAVMLSGVAWSIWSTPSRSAQAAQRGILAAAARQAPVIVKIPAPEPAVTAKPELTPDPRVQKQPVIRKPVKGPPVVVTPPPVVTPPCDLRCQMERAVKQPAKPKR